jgi:ketosteroid isomerase-like protein
VASPIRRGYRQPSSWLDEIVVDGDRALALGTAYDTRAHGAYVQRLGWILEFDDGLIFKARSYDTWDQARAAL